MNPPPHIDGFTGDEPGLPPPTRLQLARWRITLFTRDHSDALIWIGVLLILFSDALNLYVVMHRSCP